MTCVIGLEYDGGVVIGGDSAGCSGWDIIDRSDEKVFEKDGYLIGFAGSYRLGQLLRYSIDLPKFKSKFESGDPFAFMVREFVPVVRDALAQEGALRKKEDISSTEGALLVGLQGRLYLVDADLQVAQSRDGYMAIGIGDRVALGALYVTNVVPVPERRVMSALGAAEHFSSGVRRPFTIITKEWER